MKRQVSAIALALGLVCGSATFAVARPMAQDKMTDKKDDKMSSDDKMSGDKMSKKKKKKDDKMSHDKMSDTHPQ